MVNNMDFGHQLHSRVKRVNNAISRFLAPLPFQNSPLVEAMHYGTLLGGKRLRPFLVYATGEMFGVSQDVLDVPAAAVECIHAYSLIHDDLPAMDDDDLRRGLATCHIRFGEDNAILAGQFRFNTPGFTAVLKLLRDVKRPPFNPALKQFRTQNIQ